MNRQEQRALREIEKNLTSEDPALAELLRTYGKSRWSRMYRYAAWIAVPLGLLGLLLGNVLLLATAGVLAPSWADTADERYRSSSRTAVPSVD